MGALFGGGGGSGNSILSMLFGGGSSAPQASAPQPSQFNNYLSAAGGTPMSTQSTGYGSALNPSGGPMVGGFSAQDAPWTQGELQAKSTQEAAAYKPWSPQAQIAYNQYAAGTNEGARAPPPGYFYGKSPADVQRYYGYGPNMPVTPPRPNPVSWAAGDTDPIKPNNIYDMITGTWAPNAWPNVQPPFRNALTGQVNDWNNPTPGAQAQVQPHQTFGPVMSQWYDKNGNAPGTPGFAGYDKNGNAPATGGTGPAGGTGATGGTGQ